MYKTNLILGNNSFITFVKDIHKYFTLIFVVLESPLYPYDIGCFSCVTLQTLTNDVRQINRLKNRLKNMCDLGF